jgi:hypothetical protein
VNVSLLGTGFSSVNTGSDGIYSFRRLDLGGYRLEFSKEGYETNSKNITVRKDTPADGDVQLTPFAPVLSVHISSLDYWSKRDAAFHRSA